MQNVMDRSQVPDQDRWDLTAIFADDSACASELRSVREAVAADPFAHVRGRLAEGPQVVRDCLQTSLDLFTRVNKLGIYAHCHSDEDTRNTHYQALQASVQALRAEASSCASFIEPELLALPDAMLAAYREAPELAPFRMSLVRIARDKPHVLGAGEEKLLSSLSDVLGASGQVFGQLTNADFDHGEITVDGVVYPVTSGRYGVLMRHGDRRVRQLAHEKMSATYIAHKNAISALYAASVRKDVALARARNHSTAREAALFRSTIPVSVYDALVEGVRAQLGHLHRYMEIRRKRLGLEAVEAFDRNVPLVDAQLPEFAFEDAFTHVVEGLAPLGEEYRAILKRARQERWVDVYETPGKRSGAYSTGFHATHPYVLLNFHGDIGHVLTLAHELGHSCHTYLSCA
ncbi:MAG: M3 family metallopeptidase, partial [Firmicutes bacterium]|nr:M3 family metallopeptidase [Bacillota bacterium]